MTRIGSAKVRCSAVTQTGHYSTIAGAALKGLPGMGGQFLCLPRTPRDNGLEDSEDLLGPEVLVQEIADALQMALEQRPVFAAEAKD